MRRFFALVSTTSTSWTCCTRYFVLVDQILTSDLKTINTKFHITLQYLLAMRNKRERPWKKDCIECYRYRLKDIKDILMESFTKKLLVLSITYSKLYVVNRWNLYTEFNLKFSNTADLWTFSAWDLSSLLIINCF